MKHVLTPASIALLILLLFSGIFLIFYGPISHGSLRYGGDTWNVVYASLFNKDFFDPNLFEKHWLLERPLQYVFDVYLLQKCFGIWTHPRAAHLALLLLFSLFVFVFGKVLEKVYPEEPVFVVFAVLFTFFYPSFFETTFIMHLITYPLVGGFFWCVCLGFFKLARVQSFLHIFLYGILTFGLYFLSVFGYENFVFTIFLFPVFTYFAKIWSNHMTTPDKMKRVLLRVALPGASMFTIIALLKFRGLQYLWFQSKVTSLTSSTPALIFSIPVLLKNIGLHGLNFFMEEVDVLRTIVGSPYRYLALGLFVSFFLLLRNQKSALTVSSYFTFLLGSGIFFLGSLPFALIGRIFPFASFAAFGVVLLFSGVLLLKRNTSFHAIGQSVMLLLLAGNIAFTFIQGDRSQKASQFQKTAFMSLLDICPDIEDGTNFIFLDAKGLMGGSHVIYFMPQIIYNNQTLYGGFAYSGKVTNGGRTLIITHDRVKADSSRSEFMPPLETLLFLKLQDNGIFELVDLHKTDALDVIWAESYFELTKDALHSMVVEGLPEDIKEDLKSLKHRAFFKEEFLSALEEHIGKQLVVKYQLLILKYAWNWTERYFELTEQSLQNLKNAGAPEIIVTRIEAVKSHRFVKEDDFMEAVEDYIGKEAGEEYRELLIKSSRKVVNSIPEVKSNTNLIKRKRVENAFTKYLASLPD